MRRVRRSKAKQIRPNAGFRLDARWPDGAWEDGYGVYVIELGTDAERKIGIRCEPGFPVLYIGQSAHSPEKRLQTHLSDPKLGSKLVRECGGFLRDDLFQHIDRFSNSRDAERAEAHHASRLAKLGFHTWYDGTHIHFEAKRIRPRLGASHLRAVEDYVDQAIFSVVASLQRQKEIDPPSPSDVAETLTFGRPNTVRDDLRLEAEFRFAYMDKVCLVDRIIELVERDFLRESADGVAISG